MSFINRKKSIRKIQGLGLQKITYIYNKVGLNFKKKKVYSTIIQNKKFSALKKKFSYDQTLKNKVKRAISFYLKIKNFRGMRHISKHPVRGQRTRTNAKTHRRLSLDKKNKNYESQQKNKKNQLQKKLSKNISKKKISISKKK